MMGEWIFNILFVIDVLLFFVVVMWQLVGI